MSSDTGLRELLGLGDYMRMWGARLASTAAQQMLMVAVGWQMYELTHSAWDLGLVGLYQFVPALMFTLVAGHAADRMHRGRIIAACLVAQAVVALVLLAATAGWAQAGSWLGRDLLLGLSVVLGLARAFQMPAQQALAPLLVPAPLLPRATAFNSAGTEVAVIGGPALGGLVFVAGAGAVYGVCLSLLLLAAVLALRLRYRHVAPAHEPVTLASVSAGLTFVWRSKLLLGAVSLDLFAVLLGGATALLPMFAKDILQVGPWGLGLLRAAPAVGALLMSLVLTRWSISARRWCNWKRPTRCAGGSAPSIRSLSARPTNSANSSRVRPPPGSGRSAPWCSGAWAPCWWPPLGCVCFLRWPTAIACRALEPQSGLGPFSGPAGRVSAARPPR